MIRRLDDLTNLLGDPKSDRRLVRERIVTLLRYISDVIGGINGLAGLFGIL